MKPRQRRSKIERVRIDTLRVPRTGQAQRPFHQSKGDKIAADFHIDSFGFPVVCRTEGVNWLVDGQHRVYAIQKCKHATSTDDIECEVYEGQTITEMARMFLGRNHSTPVTAFERFAVAVTAGYPTESAIAGIVSKARLKIGHAGRNGNVFSVGALRRVYDREGEQVLERVLCVLRDAYESSGHAFSARLIDGTALVLGTYPHIDDKTLIRALASEQHGVHGLLRRTEDYRERLGRAVPQCIAASVVDIYNRQAGKKRQLVKWWKVPAGGRLRQAARAT